MRWISYILLLMPVVLAAASSQGAEQLLPFPGTSFADAREENIEDFQSNVVIPWFQKGDYFRFTSPIPYEGHRIRLRGVRFMRDDAKASVLILHGFGERFEKYMETSYDFYHAGLNVYLYDMRGHGVSDRVGPDPQQVEVDEFTYYPEDLKAFVDTIVEPEAKGKPIFIFGHSMGGAVATLYAQKYPGKVRALVLTAPMLRMLSPLPLGLSQKVSEFVSLLGFGHTYAPGQKPPSKSYWVFERAGTSSYGRWKVYRDFMLIPEIEAHSNGGGTFHWLGKALATIIPMTHEHFPPSVHIPILMFQGQKDNWVDISGQTDFCKMAPNCRLINYPEGKHELFMEKDTIRIPYLGLIFAYMNEKMSLGAEAH